MTSASSLHVRRSQGAALRRLRTEGGLTLRGLGEALGVTHTFLLDVEQGERSFPKERMDALAVVLGVEARALWEQMGMVACERCKGTGLRAPRRAREKEVRKSSLKTTSRKKKVEFFRREARCSSCGTEVVNLKATKYSVLNGLSGWRFVMGAILACSEECQEEIEKSEGVVHLSYIDTQGKLVGP